MKLEIPFVSLVVTLLLNYILKSTMVRERIDRSLCADHHMTHYGSGMPVFQGDIRQDGYGLGALLMRFAAPLLKPIVRTVGKDLISGGGKILSSVVKRGVPMLADKVNEKLFGSSKQPNVPLRMDASADGDFASDVRVGRRRRLVGTKKSRVVGVGGRRKRRRVTDILD